MTVETLPGALVFPPYPPHLPLCRLTVWVCPQPSLLSQCVFDPASKLAIHAQTCTDITFPIISF